MSLRSSEFSSIFTSDFGWALEGGMHLYALIHILSNKLQFPVASNADPIAAVAVFYSNRELSFSRNVPIDALEILTSLPVDIDHHERPSKFLLLKIESIKFVACNTIETELTQFFGGQRFQVQTQCITVGNCFGRIHIVITEHWHRHQWHTVVHTFEHAQEASMSNKCSQFSMT